MKQTALALAALLALAPMAGSAVAQTSNAPGASSGAAKAALSETALAGAERTQALAAASAALNRITAIQGRFTQVAPDGAQSQGELYLQRPGKMRFAYDAPSPLTIVSDGTTVAVEDRAVRDVSRVPLRSTPLFYVLKRDVNLERDARITRVTRSGDQLLVTARDRSGEADGEITMVFAGPAYDLRQWSITDGQRQTTRIKLSAVRRAGALDPRLFRVQAGADPTARKGR
ncbi:MAG: outer membrane lipoprotein carrier protein LolA [Hyphomonadaceae bacterium]|nr:outer membrane lipoprotein carrier protein LolA [Hyphomonadaceae bacterium]